MKKKKSSSNSKNKDKEEAPLPPAKGRQRRKKFSRLGGAKGTVVTGDIGGRSHEVDAKMGDAFTASGKEEEKEEWGSRRFADVVPENLICLSFWKLKNEHNVIHDWC